MPCAGNVNRRKICSSSWLELINIRKVSIKKVLDVPLITGHFEGH
jgi:hypothetical protein